MKVEGKLVWLLMVFSVTTGTVLLVIGCAEVQVLLKLCVANDRRSGHARMTPIVVVLFFFVWVVAHFGHLGHFADHAVFRGKSQQFSDHAAIFAKAACQEVVSLVLVSLSDRLGFCSSDSSSEQLCVLQLMSPYAPFVVLSCFCVGARLLEPTPGFQLQGPPVEVNQSFLPFCGVIFSSRDDVAHC